MASDRKLEPAPAAIKRRPAATVQRNPASNARLRAPTLQERLGNHGTRAFLAAKASRSSGMEELEAERTRRKGGGGNPKASDGVTTCPDCEKSVDKNCVADATKNGQTCDKDECKECQNGKCIKRTSPATAFNANTVNLTKVAATQPFGDKTVYGLTWEESISVKIDARCDNGKWTAVLTGLTGNYSQQVRLLPGGQNEVAGTDAKNFCDQARALDSLGNNAGKWYMLSAVQAHENVHLTRFIPGLIKAAPLIEPLFEALSVPTAKNKTKAQAIAQIRALPAFAAAMKAGRNLWFATDSVLLAKDHDAGGPTDQAERAIVDPVIKRICQTAKTNRWAACPVCPP